MALELDKKDPRNRGIYVRKNQYWIDWRDETGKRHREPAGASLPAARDFRNEKLLTEQKRKHGMLPSRIEEERRSKTLADAIEEFRPEFEHPKKNPKGRKENARHAQRWAEWFGSVPLTELTTDSLKGWKHRRELEVSGATVNRELAYLSALCNKVLKSSQFALGKNPVKGVERCEEPESRRRIISREDEARLATVMSRVDWLAFQLCLHTGLRQSELLRIRRRDVDLQNRNLALPKTKAKQFQDIPLNSVAVEILGELLESHDQDLLFPGQRKGKPLCGTSLTKRLVAHCLDLGINTEDMDTADQIVWHSTRHTFISRLAMEGIGITTLRELARHAKIEQTLKYTHLMPSVKREAVDLLGKKYQPGGRPVLSVVDGGAGANPHKIKHSVL